MVQDIVFIPRSERIAFDIPVRARVGGRRATLTLRDLTPHGARVEGMEGLELGAMTMLQLPTLAPKAAKVVWFRGSAVGLEFEHPLHVDVFERLVRAFARSRTRGEDDIKPLYGERLATSGGSLLVDHADPARSAAGAR
jgi:hypothetical protein